MSSVSSAVVSASSASWGGRDGLAVLVDVGAIVGGGVGVGGVGVEVGTDVTGVGVEVGTDVAGAGAEVGTVVGLAATGLGDGKVGGSGSVVGEGATLAVVGWTEARVWTKVGVGEEIRVGVGDGLGVKVGGGVGRLGVGKGIVGSGTATSSGKPARLNSGFD